MKENFDINQERKKESDKNITTAEAMFVAYTA